MEGYPGSGKKTFLIAALGLILVAAGYFGWSKMHPGTGQSAEVQKFAPVEVPPAAAIPQAASPNPPVAAASTPPPPAAPSAANELRAQEAAPIAAAPDAKAALPKPSAAIAVPAPATKTPTDKTQEPIVVKNDSKKADPIAAGEEAAQPPASGVLGVGSSADEAISGIMSTTSVNRLPQSAPQTLRVSQGISQGMLLKRVQPVYPQQARQLRLQGPVQLEANIGKDGSITKIKQISGDAVLGRAALDAVRQWKYKPYYLNGEPVEIQTQITVNFKLP